MCRERLRAQEVSKNNVKQPNLQYIEHVRRCAVNEEAILLDEQHITIYKKSCHRFFDSNGCILPV
jgi:hypothetical protein